MRGHGSGELGHRESHGKCGRQWWTGRWAKMETGENGTNRRENGAQGGSMTSYCLAVFNH